MNGYSSGMRNGRVWACLCLALALAACRVGPGEEITSTKPYADLIGATYSVVSDNLRAHGVYESIDDRTRISYVTLVPMELDGIEFAFRRNVPKGQVIRILSAWSNFKLFESGVYYRVAVENSDLPPGIPIRLGLSRGNGGVGADLNPAVYKKLPRDN
jgi:hypothetical protein